MYDSRRWRDRIRPAILGRDPLCKIGVLCHGLAPSTEVDHIVPVEQGGSESEINLRGACHACHSHKTRLEQRGQWHERQRSECPL